MNRTVALGGSFALLASGLGAQSKPTAPAELQGVWRVAEISTQGPGTSTNARPQPGVFIFTAKHYSMTRETDTTSRPPVNARTATADELRVTLQFIAHAGTYEIFNGELVLHRVVALTANTSAGNFTTYSYRVEGDSLWLTLKATQAGAATNPATLKLMRIE